MALAHSGPRDVVCHVCDAKKTFSLEMVQHVPKAGLPPAHIGVAAGPVVAQGGDYFRRTVNLARGSSGGPAQATFW